MELSPQTKLLADKLKEHYPEIKNPERVILELNAVICNQEKKENLSRLKFIRRISKRRTLWRIQYGRVWVNVIYRARRGLNDVLKAGKPT